MWNQIYTQFYYLCLTAQKCEKTNNKGYEEINNYNFCDKTFVTRNSNVEIKILTKES